jgi:hypothetical protein
MTVWPLQVFRIDQSDYLYGFKTSASHQHLAFLGLKRDIPVGFAVSVICLACYRALINL